MDKFENILLMNLSKLKLIDIIPIARGVIRSLKFNKILMLEAALYT